MQPSAEHMRIAARLPALAREFGFEQAGVAGIDLAQSEARLERWLELGRHGTMGWMARHGRKRTRPAELLRGTLRVLCFRMHYWSREAAPALAVLADPDKAYISRYALGRDYHRLMRRRLRRLAERIASTAGPMGYRVFVDSAPVMEKPLAAGAGLGWIGKHTNLINRTKARGSSSARSIPTSRYRWMTRLATTAAVAGHAWTSVPRRPSWRRINSTPGAVSPTSP